MSKALKPIPDGYHTLTPVMAVAGAAKALDFYKTAFGAVELFRMDAPGGKVAHAEFQIGDSKLMIADEHPEMNFRGPGAFGGSPVSFYLYVENVDAFVEKAVAAGAQITQPVQDQFYGDRVGTLKDPFGHTWSVGTHVEDLTPEEIAERAKKMGH